MKSEQRSWNRVTNWSKEGPSKDLKPQLVFVFGETSLLQSKSQLQQVKQFYPGAFIFGCSTSGEIHGSSVTEDTVTSTAIQFKSTKIQHAVVSLADVPNCHDAGVKLATAISHQELRHVFVLSVGLNVNGSDLVKGLSSKFPSGVSITGGLAGDKARFKETVIVAGDLVSENSIAIVGLYGSHLEIGTSSVGGWDPFGPERLVTKSKGNILYELDGKSALDLYKTYLGDHAKDLPASALLFPLCLRSNESKLGIVRTILGVNESDHSMTFAGDVPEGSHGRFMRANIERIIEGAINAAKVSAEPIKNSKPQFALLISCVGRKLVLNQRTEEEIEGVREILGAQAAMTGFYSYGEISPFISCAKSELHNQTMTLTTLSETDET